MGCEVITVLSISFLALLKNGQQQLQASVEPSNKFQNAAAVHKEAALRHLSSMPSEEYSSSSSEDELEDSKSNGVLDKLKSSFGAASGIHFICLHTCFRRDLGLLIWVNYTC